MAKSTKTIKVCLTNGGDDHETPWAHDLGPAPGPKGSRKVRLVNVPFKHAKPTWGDVVIVSPVKNGFPTWDRGGAPWSKVGALIEEDSGRWAMIVDYVPRGAEDDEDLEACFDALAHACAELEIVCEGAWAPRGRGAGRVYLAVQSGTSDKAVMNHLARAEVPCRLTQVHPAPVVTAAKSGAPKRTKSAKSARPAKASTKKRAVSRR